MFTVPFINSVKRRVPASLKHRIKSVLGSGQAVDPKDRFPILASTNQEWPIGRPLVTVVIPCYNYGRYLEAAIDSVFQQSLQDLEIIVVNDGSTDPETTALLHRLDNPMIRVHHQPNLGLSEARNQGIRLGRGKYVCCLDADDTLHPTYLEKAVALLEADPGVSFAYPWVRLFGDEEGIWRTEPFDLEKLLRYNHISVAGVFKRSAWSQVGGYCKELRHGYEDWEFWMRLGEAGLRGQLIPEALLNHRRHGKTMTHTAFEKHDEIVADIRERHARLFDEPKQITRIARKYRRYRVHNPCQNLDRQAEFKGVTTAERRLLVVVPWLTVGGAESVLFQMLHGLQADGWKTHIVTTHSSPNEWDARFSEVAGQIYHLHNFLPEYAWEEFLKYLIRNRSISALLNSSNEFGYQVLPSIKNDFPELRTIDLVHNDSEFGCLRQSIEADRYIDLHLSGSNHIRDCYRRIGGIDDRKTRAIYNGVDVEYCFNPARYDREVCKQKYGLPTDRKVVTFLGRLSPEKRPDRFLRLAAQLVTRPDVQFLLVGDGELRDETAERINRLRLRDRLIWLKGVPPQDVPHILAASDALALTSDTEGFPMVVLEALAMCVPVVTFDIGEVRTSVEDGMNGYVVPAGALEMFSDRLVRLLDDSELRHAFAQRAREQIIEKGLTLTRFVSEYKEVFDSACCYSSVQTVCDDLVALAA